jgi:hypothetical protein
MRAHQVAGRQVVEWPLHVVEVPLRNGGFDTGGFDMRRDRHQRLAYAVRRMGKAGDRMICAKDQAEKDRAAQWLLLWAARGGIRAGCVPVA